ncbi:hypothetical protein A3H65_02175 [Candidatus Giovannonibacteria bacterium RIFCSPLOWO2_02_FULL_45_14]|nr:MAG: hypothetical protein A3C75_02970 [Candidatus Giovannonibacteria bacterium RIFCSPHIGHO2_02_FULL_44_31]OGF76730.1 MAG: hypothetical protein A3E62_02905 [Candidatus Giovannonibacteria bacterium RIFCSPHIGHO2_12_FULL_44_29]OGF90715.1 MAG: hypothetical protein A3H65_02175 [Candidatus Giovannonibacteria bacterium RIFCSPLOWO2_02_FULL_45_14]
MGIARDIELLYEVSAFRNVERVWKQFLGTEVANNAEHTFRVIWIALTLGKYEGKVNLEKIIKMALIHDFEESRCGDVHYLSRQYTKRDKKMAIEDIFEGTILHDEFIKIFDEYEKRKTKESKIVKDADNLDVQIELSEIANKGNKLSATWKKHRDKYVYPKLFTKSARKFWQAFYKSNPHDWHLKSPRNRFNAGDWKR